MAEFELDLDELGMRIGQAVDQAIRSQDFQKLNQKVTQAVEHKVRIVSQQTAKPKVVNQNPNHMITGSVDRLYAPTTGKSALGILGLVIAGNVILFGATAILGFTMTENPTSSDYSALVFCLVVVAIGALLMLGCVKLLQTLERFKHYKRILGYNTHCTFAKLARDTGKSESFVRKDVQDMIRQGYFKEGHLDADHTSLITSHETYRYYESCAAQQKAAVAARTSTTVQKALDPRVKEVVDRGNSFVRQIRKCNDEIPGEEISNKIDRMEHVVLTIFTHAQAHPEVIPDLKKLMEYYLPMTVKLLSAYAEMDRQPVQGETILASKKEIEDTLDTLNLAFEKLLDSVFENTALDVSSDISVLNTLLAQEGLTEDGFDLTKD